MFDVWGNGVPVAEQICMTSPIPNALMISESTQVLVSQQFMTQLFCEISLFGASVHIYGVFGNVVTSVAGSVADVIQLGQQAVPVPMLPDLPGFIPLAVDFGLFHESQQSSMDPQFVFVDSAVATPQLLSSNQPVAVTGAEVRFTPIDEPQ